MLPTWRWDTVLTEQVFIALGSNIGDREKNLIKAIELLENEPEIEIVKQSSFIDTQAVGPIEQESFLNAVIEIRTTLIPKELLTNCLAIEEKLGRTRAVRWGPRTIDLDILFYGDQTIEEPHLIIPHPELLKRAFVLEPLSEIAPDFVHPRDGLTTTQMLELL